MYEQNKTLYKYWLPLLKEINKVNYAHNFTWMGLTVVKMPEDLHGLQELVWEIKPDMIIETGVALGGSILHKASLLTLLEDCGIIEEGKVIGIDIRIQRGIREVIEKHPFSKKIILIQGSSTDKDVVNKVYELAKGKKIILELDSAHSYQHVLGELRAYSQLAEYIIVNDTGLEDIGRRKRDNPKMAVRQFLKENKDFIIDDIELKLLMTGHPNGYLRRVK